MRESRRWDSHAPTRTVLLKEARRTRRFSLARNEISPSGAARLRGKFSVLSKKVFPRANRSSEMLCRADFRARRKTARAGLRLHYVAGAVRLRQPRCRP